MQSSQEWPTVDGCNIRWQFPSTLQRAIALGRPICYQFVHPLNKKRWFWHHTIHTHISAALQSGVQNMDKRIPSMDEGLLDMCIEAVANNTCSLSVIQRGRCQHKGRDNKENWVTTTISTSQLYMPSPTMTPPLTLLFPAPPRVPPFCCVSARGQGWV